MGAETGPAEPRVRVPSIFHELGVPAVINACGIFTDLGGSILSPSIWSAMTELNMYFTDMPTLLDATGGMIAEMVGAEAARVTPGASAGIALSAGACMAGMDGEAWERLPDTAGLRNEIVMQRNQVRRYKYTRCARLAGAHIVEAGNEAGTAAAQLAASIGPGTAAVFVPAHLDGEDGCLALRDVAHIAHERGVPVIVDAAYMNFPPEIMGSYTAAGADLVCFSAKYFWGPNAGGFVCGRRDLVEAVAGLDFTGYESGRYRTFGRAFKLDRWQAVAVVLALRDWIHMDHDARFATYRRQVDRFIERVGTVQGIRMRPMCFAMDERFVPEPVNCVQVQVDAGGGSGAASLAERLRAGTPSIRVIVDADAVGVVMETVREGDEVVIADRLREAAGGRM